MHSTGGGVVMIVLAKAYILIAYAEVSNATPSHH